MRRTTSLFTLMVLFTVSAFGAPVTKPVLASMQPPADFIAARVQKVLTELKSRPMRPQGQREIDITTSTSKNDWLLSLYTHGLIEASWATEMLADKRILSEVLVREMGTKAYDYYPRTVGLREFLVSHALVTADGSVVKDGDRIEEVLHEEFPAGFTVRPAVGVAPQETAHGLFASPDLFIMDLLSANSSVYRAEHYLHPVRSHILNAVASGEAVVLQEDIVGAADARKALLAKHFSEVRIHTYENHVVDGSIPLRWVQTDLLTAAQESAASDYAARFLADLSPALLNHQAWGIDVGVLDNGEMRINDIVTNRGRQMAWSSYLDQPRVIAAYTKFFEKNDGVEFKGLSGSLLRHGWANYFAYWGLRIEKARPGFHKVLAYLPPFP